MHQQCTPLQKPVLRLHAAQLYTDHSVVIETRTVEQLRCKQPLACCCGTQHRLPDVVQMSGVPGSDLHYLLKLDFLEAVFGCRYRPQTIGKHG